MADLNCGECGMPIKFGKKVWFFKGKSYHPECVQDNSSLYTLWITKECYGNRKSTGQ